VTAEVHHFEAFETFLKQTSCATITAKHPSSHVMLNRHLVLPQTLRHRSQFVLSEPLRHSSQSSKSDASFMRSSYGLSRFLKTQRF